MALDVEHALWVASERLTALKGFDFFRALVEELSAPLGIAHALITERVSPDAARVRTLAFVRDGRPAEDAEYDLAGTPCEPVIAGAELAVPEGVRGRFPTCPALVDLRAEAFAAVPVRSLYGRVLGHLALIHTAPLPDTAALLPLMRRLAARAAAELERVRSDERLRQVCETITQVFWLTDVSKNQMLYVSPAYEAIWGRIVESLYAAPRSWLDAIHEEDRPRVLAAATTLQAQGFYDVDYRIVRPDGTVRMIRDRAYPVRGPGGTVTRVCGVAEDVTGWRRAQSELEQSRKLQALGRLANSVAHDFNTILTIVRAAAEFMVDELPPDSPAREGGEAVRRAVAKGAGLTQRLMALGKTKACPLTPCDVNVVVADTAALVSGVFSSGVRLEIRLGAGLPPARVGRSELEQVLLNLVMNARDATPRGGEVRLETLAGTLPGDGAAPAVVLRVSDTGTGMDAETLAHLAEPYFTTKPEGKGTGLGLTTVYGIVEEAGGRVAVQSAPGRGTVFTVSIPAAPRPAPSS